MFPWHIAEFDEIETLMGGDPWPYGVEPNRPTLEATIKYLKQQHMIARDVSVDELFAPMPGALD